MHACIQLQVQVQAQIQVRPASCIDQLVQSLRLHAHAQPAPAQVAPPPPAGRQPAQRQARRAKAYSGGIQCRRPSLQARHPSSAHVPQQELGSLYHSTLAYGPPTALHSLHAYLFMQVHQQYAWAPCPFQPCCLQYGQWPPLNHQWPASQTSHSQPNCSSSPSSASSNASKWAGSSHGASGSLSWAWCHASPLNTWSSTWSSSRSRSSSLKRGSQPKKTPPSAALPRKPERGGSRVLHYWSAPSPRSSLLWYRNSLHTRAPLSSATGTTTVWAGLSTTKRSEGKQQWPRTWIGPTSMAPCTAYASRARQNIVRSAFTA